MGVVYAAYDDKLERKVALKLIRGAAMRRPDGRARGGGRVGAGGLRGP
jgi:hypothetical protein